MKKFILTTIIILSSFFVIPKVEAQTISQILYGYDFLYQVYDNDLTNEVRSQNIFANGTSNIPIMVLSRKYTQLSSLYGNELSFSFNVSSGKTAIGYNASITFTIATDGVNISEFIGNGLTGYVRFSQGTLKSETSKVTIVNKTTNSLTLTINSRATLETSTTLKSAYIYLNANNLFGIYYCAGSGFPNGCGYGTSSNTLNVQLKNINLDVEYYEDVNSTILGGIESEVSDINDKLDNYNQTQQETNNQLNDLNNNINNDNTDEATNEASEFFSTFETDTFGLTSIITAPLTLIQSITSTTCSSLGLPLPYVDETLNLPCLSSIYEEHFGVFLDIYQTITFGIVAYWVCVRIFNLVKDFKNPEHDEIEVLDL